MAAHGACSSPGSAAAGFLQRVQVSGFRLLRRASATPKKCCKIQAPRGLREIGPGRTANVHFLLVFTGQNGPPMQKTIIKSLILMAAWLRPPAPASAQAGAGGRGSAAIPRGGPGRTANVHFLLVFTGQTRPPMQKTIIKSLIWRAAWLRPPAPASAQQAPREGKV